MEGRTVITMRVVLDETRSEVVFTSSNGKVLGPIKGTFVRRALGEQWKDFHSDLDEFKDLVGPKLDAVGERERRWRLGRLRDAIRGKTLKRKAKSEYVWDALTGKRDVDWEFISAAVQKLLKQGQYLMTELFAGERHSEVEKYFNEVHPMWEKDIDDIKALPLVRLIAPPESVLPVEFLPAFKVYPDDEIESYEDLLSTMRSFIGFSAIVERERPLVSDETASDGERELARTLVNLPKLPVRFFAHAGLTACVTEFRALDTKEKLGNAIEVEGPWPDRGNTDKPKEFVHELVKHIWTPEHTLTGETRSVPIQVNHFSCHCDTVDKNSPAYEVILSPDGRKEVGVSIKDLQTTYGRITTATSSRAKMMRPLIFFNACGSATINPAGMTSFPKHFLERHSRGFIGTETLVPDYFAAEFSREFYAALLIDGRVLGEAMLVAKWRTLKNFKNPMGILYIVYADPEMKVLKPRKDL